MGLLDALNIGGQPQGGGLLDFFLRNAMNQQPMTGLASDQAQYGQPPMQAMAQMPLAAPVTPQRNAQPSPLDNAQWPFGPMGAPSQANAQMMPSVAQQPPPPVISAQPAQAQESPPAFAGGGIFGRLGNPDGLIARLTGNDSRSVAQQAQNATKQWLLQRGVDPVTVNAAMAQPELLKTMIDETKTKPVQALGSGYIWDPKQNKAVRAYEPEDKIPAGFVKDDSGNMKFIPGGPADPAYIQLAEAKKKDPNGVFTLGRGGELYKLDKDGNPVIVHKNESGADAPMLSEEGQHLMAERILNGEKGVTAGFARSKGDMAGIYNKVAEKATARHIDASDILSNINNEYAAASAARSFGGMTAKQETYSNTAAKAIDIAEKASEAVPRSTWVPINKAILAYKEKSGDPKVAALGQSLETLTQEYARAVGGGHGTVSDKEEAREYLAKAQTHEQLVARFNIMRQEIARGRESVGESAAHVGGIYRNNIRRGSVLPDPGTKEAESLTAPGPSATGLPSGWSVKVR